VAGASCLLPRGLSPREAGRDKKLPAADEGRGDPPTLLGTWAVPWRAVAARRLTGRLPEGWRKELIGDLSLPPMLLPRLLQLAVTETVCAPPASLPPESLPALSETRRTTTTSANSGGGAVIAIGGVADGSA
jgi:hypothetical protein